MSPRATSIYQVQEGLHPLNLMIAPYDWTTWHFLQVFGFSGLSSLLPLLEREQLTLAGRRQSRRLACLDRSARRPASDQESRTHHWPSDRLHGGHSQTERTRHERSTLRCRGGSKAQAAGVRELSSAASSNWNSIQAPRRSGGWVARFRLCTRFVGSEQYFRETIFAQGRTQVGLRCWR